MYLRVHVRYVLTAILRSQTGQTIVLWRKVFVKLRPKSSKEIIETDSKIENFYQAEPVISFYKENIIFFDDRGTILQFDKNSRLVWKKNYYTKSEKKLDPILQFANNNQY